MSPALRVGLLLIGLAMPAGSLIAGPPERGPMPHRVDLYGDPLPEGAVARLGSVRLRHAGLKDFALLPDGKTVVSVGENQMVYWWDLDTGRRTGAVRLPDEIVSYKLAVSRDGKVVATHRASRLFIADAATGTVVETIATDDKFVDCLVLAPDGAVVAVGSDGYRVTLIDRKHGQSKSIRLAEAKDRTGHRPFLRVSFSRDAARVVVCGIDGDKGMSVIEVATGRELYSRTGYVESADISADGSLIAACEFDASLPDARSVLQLHDVTTGKVTAWEPDGLDRGRFQVSFAPDGRSVACVGKHRGCLIDVKTGRVLRPAPHNVERVQFSPDGRRWASRGWGRLHVWDTENARPLHEEPAGATWYGLAVSPATRWLAVEANEMPPTVQLWDSASGRLVRRFPLAESHYKFDNMLFSSDGRTLHAVAAGGVYQSWRVRNGRGNRPVPVWGHDERAGPYHDYRLSPDGRVVAAIVPPPRDEDRPCRLDIWNAATGEVIHRHTLDLREWASAEAWMADGIWIAVRVQGGVTFVDPQTGRVGPRVPAKDKLSYSPDGRTLMAWEGGPEETGSVRVWEVASGQLVAVIPTHRSVFQGFGLAMAARAAVIAEGRSLRVIDLTTGNERGRRALPDFGFGYMADHPVGELHVLPGGQQALTEVRDGTALIWDLTAFPPPPLSDKHGEPELLAWWDELAGADAAKAYAAGWKLSEAPADGVVAFLRPRLRAATSIDADEIRKRIADLDSPTFATREAASRRLQQVGPALLPYLRKRPAAPSAEAVERLQTLEERLSDPVPPAETLRALRAVAVLERVATTDARKLLEELARGASGAAETKAARAALVRMRQEWTRP
jgi:WD40 repeat protein